jgi:replicative DNA helicase Mcm
LSEGIHTIDEDLRKVEDADAPEKKLLEFFQRNSEMKRELLELWRLYPEKKSVVVDYNALAKYGVAGIYYADKLLNKPRLIKSDFESVLYELSPADKREELIRNITFRFKGINYKVQIRDLRAADINHLISFDGVIRTVGQVKPKISTAVFRCQNCGDPVREPQRSTKVEYPTEGICKHCGQRARWTIDLETSRFVNCQRVVMQEYHEGLKASEQPYTIDVELLDDLCGVVNAGTRATLIGMPRVIEKDKKSLGVDTIVEGNWIDLGEQSFTDMIITEAEEIEIRKMAEAEDILHRVASSIAPSIYGHETIKSAIALQLFGGVERIRGKNRTRGDIHILLLGDPGIAKSQMLDFVAATSPRGVSASGGQSTNAGLTCAAKQDGQGDWMLEGGALVLADSGMCCIDEFDKMSKDDRAAIHKAMEQQKLDVHKAGLNATLMTRCSILAAANPKAGRWDPYGNISEQIDLPPSLLSRFDLIFIMRDVPENELDDKIASHILEGADTPDGIADDVLRKYIALAKRSCTPGRSEEANATIKEFYLRLRGMNRDGTVPITPRKLEDLKRLTEASARMKLHDVADASDAKVAVSIVEACLREVAYDDKSGKFDIDRVISNVSGRQRKDVVKVLESMKIYGQPMHVAQIYLACADFLSKEAVDVALEKMGLNSMVCCGPDKLWRIL